MSNLKRPKNNIDDDKMIKHHYGLLLLGRKLCFVGHACKTLFSVPAFGHTSTLVCRHHEGDAVKKNFNQC